MKNYREFYIKRGGGKKESKKEENKNGKMIR